MHDNAFGRLKVLNIHAFRPPTEYLLDVASAKSGGISLPNVLLRACPTAPATRNATMASALDSDAKPGSFTRAARATQRASLTRLSSAARKTLLVGSCDCRLGWVRSRMPCSASLTAAMRTLSLLCAGLLVPVVRMCTHELSVFKLLVHKLSESIVSSYYQR